MDVSILRETQAREHRVALTPSGVKALVQDGHRVWVETGAGQGANHSDADYQSAGASVAFSRLESLTRGALLLGVGAPQAAELEVLRRGQLVLAFWALPAARPETVRALLDRGVTAVGLEAIEDDAGDAPVLTSMSEIAGRLAITVGAGLLLNELGGSGVLLGGAPGVPPAQLVVLGAGVLGRSAARAALGVGAQVTLIDRHMGPLRAACAELPHPVGTMLSSRPNLAKALGFADVVLCAVAVHGRRAPLLVTRDMLRHMKPRALVMDLSIDMGGSFESSRPTAFPEPTYDVEGIRHFCVPNLPSMAARTATQALTNALLPYLSGGAAVPTPAQLLASSADLRRGTYVHDGTCARRSLASTFGLPFQPVPGE
jgi:alanine dehydrogenase